MSASALAGFVPVASLLGVLGPAPLVPALPRMAVAPMRAVLLLEAEVGVEQQVRRQSGQGMSHSVSRAVVSPMGVPAAVVVPMHLVASVAVVISQPDPEGGVGRRGSRCQQA